MKNKVKYILILFLVVTMIFVVGVNVYAETENSNIPETYEVKNKDIPNSTYVIGTHMFTRETNEEIGYDGQLSTQLIMLASKTIKSENLRDMIIYYKNPRGKWVNALTNNTINAPETFDISKKDLVKFVPTPVLQANTHIYSNLNQFGYIYINLKNKEIYYSESDEHTYNISGIEFSETWYGGDGVKRYSIINSFNNPDSYARVSEGDTFVARAYVLDDEGNKIYSDYSNEINIDLYNNTMSFEEFNSINNETTLGELKTNYYLEPSIANLDKNATEYLYDFKGYFDNAHGVTPNVQFEFGSENDSAVVKAKVYRNAVSDQPIDHSKYDDGDGIIELDDFDSIELTTVDALIELLGKPYIYKAIYDREGSGGIPSVEYPTVELTYKLKNSDKIINFSFANSGKGRMIATDYATANEEILLNKEFVTEDEKFVLKITSFSDDYYHNKIDFTLTSKSGEVIYADGEVRATTLDKLQIDYIFRGAVDGGVIVGRLRESGSNKFIMDSYVFKETEDPNELPEELEGLNIGYNKLEFNLKSE